MIMTTTKMEKIIGGEASDYDMSQGAGPSDTSSPSEEETQGNIMDTILRSFERARKPLSPYEPFFKEIKTGPNYLV